MYQPVIGTKLVPNGLRFDVIDLDFDLKLAEDVSYSLANALKFHLSDPTAPLFVPDETLTAALASARAKYAEEVLRG